MLANFLEKESAPSTQIRLPTDYLRSNSTSDVMESGGEFAPDAQRKSMNPISSVQHRPSSSAAQQEHSVVVLTSMPQRKPTPSKNPLLSGLSAIKPPSDVL